MPPKKVAAKRGKTAHESAFAARPPNQQSIIVSFAKQIKRKKCTICLQEFPSGIFPSHRLQCSVQENDEDCQVILVQTRAEKAAAGLITLDEDEKKATQLTVKQEKRDTPKDASAEKSIPTRPRRTPKRRLEDGGDDDVEGQDADDDWQADGTEETEEEPEPSRPKSRGRRSHTPKKKLARRSTRISIVRETTEVEETPGFKPAPVAVRRGSAARSDTQEMEVLKEVLDEELDATFAAMETPPMEMSAEEGSQEDAEPSLPPTPPPPPERRESRRRRILEEEDVVPDSLIPPRAEKITVAREIPEKVRRPEFLQEREEDEVPDSLLPPRAKITVAKDVPGKDRRLDSLHGVTRNVGKKAISSPSPSLPPKRTTVARGLAKNVDPPSSPAPSSRSEEEPPMPLDKLMEMTLKILSRKIERHERGLVPSQEIVNAPVVVLDDEDPKVVPHYVYLICVILKRVLSCPTPDGRHYDDTFWGEDLRIISSFLGMKDDAKLLFIRLFTRKRSWHIPAKLNEKYAYLGDRVEPALKELAEAELLETSKGLTDAAETLRLLSSDGIKAVAKAFRVNFKLPKNDIISALLETVVTQKPIFANLSATTPQMQGRLLKLAKKELGAVYRTSARANRLFRAALTLYSPALSDSALFAEDHTINVISAMMFRMKEIHEVEHVRRAPFPCPTIIGIYRTSVELYEYVDAKDVEESQVRAADRRDIATVKEMANKARQMLSEESDKSLKSHLASLPRHLRQFTTQAVQTRILLRGAECLEKEKNHVAAINWHRLVLHNKVLRLLVPDLLGAIYERVALNLHFHCKEPEEAIDEIRRAMKDPLVHDKNRLNLEARAIKILDEGWKKVYTLEEAEVVTIEGDIIGRDLGDERKNRFVRRNANGDEEAISVEAVAMDHFLARGMDHGLHTEGELWHSSLNCLLRQELFDHNVENAWLCELQAHPLDLNHDLYSPRSAAIDVRLAWIRGSTAEERMEAVGEAWVQLPSSNLPMTTVQSFVATCPPSVLADVFDILVKQHRHRRSGFPDLVLWNERTGKIMVCEVKGPGDILSSKQKLWLDFFTKAQGIRAVTCRVTAAGRKRLQ